jgi:hypothetical protein
VLPLDIGLCHQLKFMLIINLSKPSLSFIPPPPPSPPVGHDYQSHGIEHNNTQRKCLNCDAKEDKFHIFSDPKCQIFIDRLSVIGLSVVLLSVVAPPSNRILSMTMVGIHKWSYDPLTIKTMIAVPPLRKGSQYNNNQYNDSQHYILKVWRSALCL